MPPFFFSVRRPSLLPPCPPAPTSGRMPARLGPLLACALLDCRHRMMKKRGHGNAEHRKFNVAILSEYPRIGRLRAKRRSKDAQITLQYIVSIDTCMDRQKTIPVQPFSYILVPCLWTCLDLIPPARRRSTFDSCKLACRFY